MHIHSVDHIGKLVNVSKDEKSYILHIHTHKLGYKGLSQAGVICFGTRWFSRWSYGIIKRLKDTHSMKEEKYFMLNSRAENTCINFNAVKAVACCVF